MNFGRFLRTDMIALDLRISYTPPDDGNDFSEEVESWKQKDLVVKELVELFEKSGEIRNPTKFYKDFIFREKQASTGIGKGLAIPHLRSMQARKVVTIFARAPEGVEFMSIDGEPVHLFFGITSPPYEDELYLQIFQWIARAFSDEIWLHNALLEIESADEAIKIIRSVG
ncbi:PTS sugar transporter subunit IIA [Acidobacteriota bacterium]